MTRTHKTNDVPHHHPEAEPAFQEHQIPKYFGKTGFTDQAPDKVKKNGGGRGNWGSQGGEVEDLSDFTTFKARRRTNSLGHIDNIPSKFEYNEEDPVFEEEVGPELQSVSTTSSDSSNNSSNSAKA